MNSREKNSSDPRVSVDAKVDINYTNKTTEKILRESRDGIANAATSIKDMTMAAESSLEEAANKVVVSSKNFAVSLKYFIKPLVILSVIGGVLWGSGALIFNKYQQYQLQLANTFTVDRVLGRHDISAIFLNGSPTNYLNMFHENFDDAPLEVKLALLARSTEVKRSSLNCNSRIGKVVISDSELVIYFDNDCNGSFSQYEEKVFKLESILPVPDHYDMGMLKTINGMYIGFQLKRSHYIMSYSVGPNEYSILLK